MDDNFWAHSRIDRTTGQIVSHALSSHLVAVAKFASTFAQGFGPDWARLAGCWHDLGKYRAGFQSYIRLNSDAHIEGKLPRTSDKTHSAAGALHAMHVFRSRFGAEGERAARVLAYVIAGHHAGLADWVASLDDRLLGTRASDSGCEYDQALNACMAASPDILPLPADFDLQRAFTTIPGVRSGNPLACALWIRMLFSALVDADFLDTEGFMSESKSQTRAGFPALSIYRRQLDEHLQAKAAEVESQGRAVDPVMLARNDVLRQCREKASLPAGVFSLNVPTGGGKTLSSLAFALNHAVAHGKRRVIYAIPYTSIIEQTADVFAGIFGRDAIVEHHSQADTDASTETARTRLACENWDAPLVVTTNVQLFESLFAARTSRCRKLHNIANSVIVLDEAQLLPPEFLQPILDTLQLLVAHYGVTVVLCTATQPTLTDLPRFDPRQSLRGLPPPVRIVDDEPTLFRTLDRVHIEWPVDLQASLPTAELAARLAGHECVLAIVNTRSDAAEIVAALDARTDGMTLHLSAAMCGQHRADVIGEIRERLAARRAGVDVRPLRVVSTQLVEAGVDIDFPVVYRSLAGLDSVAQAAGRCNREGLLPGGAKGLVVVFVRDIPSPLNGVRAAAQATRSTLVDKRLQTLGPEAFERYFPLYYAGFKSRDQRGIVEDLRSNADLSFAFRTAAKKFRLVDDEDQASVIVPYVSPSPDARSVSMLIACLRRGDTDRWLLRALQRYTVNTRRRQVEQWQDRGDVLEVQPGLFLLIDELRYDARFGLLPEGRALDAASLVQ
ncbi:MAG: CRISPR-associated endonuclease Cas3'' [Rhizobacter sp.]|nr:CRISPR-associated endonuclease Cas3'' [Burkholderiaceae bacterium]MCO5123026.1 CRISPR-associated endonuclease Cas3'' [Rhizobacter sp.]